MDRLRKPGPTREQNGTSGTSEFDAAYDMEMQFGFVWGEHNGPINNRSTDFSKRGDGKPETTDARKRKRDCDQQRSDGKPETTDARKRKRDCEQQRSDGRPETTGARKRRRRVPHKKRLTKAVAAEEADVTVLGRKLAMSEYVSNLPPIKKLSSVEKRKPGFALSLDVGGVSCHIGKFTDATLMLPVLNEARKELRSNGCVKADALVAPPSTPPRGDLGALMDDKDDWNVRETLRTPDRNDATKPGIAPRLNLRGDNSTKSSYPACSPPTRGNCSPPGLLQAATEERHFLNVREKLSTTASTNGLIICSDGEDDGRDDDRFAFDELAMDGLAIFDDPVVTNANAAAPSKIWDVQKSAASSATLR
jgi:hypothetical protein